MGSTYLEKCRSLNEDIERIERMVVDSLVTDPKTLKASIEQSHRVNELLETLIKKREELASIFDDPDNARKDELSAISGQGPALYSAFYDRLKDIKDYHRRFPGQTMQKPEQALQPQISVRFTGEESHGKCLDLHKHFQVYINLPLFSTESEPAGDKKEELVDTNASSLTALLKPGDKPMDYLQYLRSFATFSASRKNKDAAYRQYLQDLLDYLRDFLHRTQPMTDMDELFSQLKNSFETVYKDGTLVRQWSVGDDDDSQAKSDIDSVFCHACQRPFKKSLFDSHLSGKKHKRMAKKQLAASSDAPIMTTEKEVWMMEYLVHRLGQMLHDNVENTLVHVTKNLSRTYAEIEADLYEDEDEDSDIEDDEEDVRVTIKDYPVGWDGRPIPYWLYKLHGLGVEYKCEICGNASYMGRRAFDKHFQDWRHTHGMRCLGIPNTIHFQDITKINDAMALWKKLQKEQGRDEWKADEEEEFEDNEGRVLPRKTYNYLKAQKLL